VAYIRDKQSSTAGKVKVAKEVLVAMNTQNKELHSLQGKAGSAPTPYKVFQKELCNSEY
jgi:hypothetical protein